MNSDLATIDDRYAAIQRRLLAAKPLTPEQFLFGQASLLLCDLLQEIMELRRELREELGK